MGRSKKRSLMGVGVYPTARPDELAKPMTIAPHWCVTVDAALARKSGLARQQDVHRRGTGLDAVAWFNTGLFYDDSARPLDRAGSEALLKAAALDWPEIDRPNQGTLFGRGLDPHKRSQSGPYITNRDRSKRILSRRATVRCSPDERGKRYYCRRAEASGGGTDAGCADTALPTDRRTNCCAPTSNGCGGSRLWTRRADWATSCTWCCTRSRISRTG